MVRKLRLVSSNSIEIAVTGIDSPFLDTLLTDHPHKVATISIPFSDKTVMDFAKNVANPDREINRCAARKIVSIYKLLGVDIDVEAANENATNNVSNTEVGEATAVLDYELDCENVEPKYIIKIELGQQQPSSSSSEVQNSTEDIGHEMLNSHLEMNNVDNLVTEESDQSLTDVIISASIPLLEDISHSVGPSTHQPETCEAEEEEDHSEDDNSIESRKEQTEIHSDISVGDIVIENINETAESIGTIINDSVDQPPVNVEVDSYDEDVEADFSFHDLEEENAQEAIIQPSDLSLTSQALIQETTQSCSEEVGNVISNIFIQTTSSQSNNSCGVSLSSHLAVSKHPLRLEFIKTGLDTIKDIAKKRKRKRGQY